MEAPQRSNLINAINLIADSEEYELIEAILEKYGLQLISMNYTLDSINWDKISEVDIVYTAGRPFLYLATEREPIISNEIVWRLEPYEYYFLTTEEPEERKIAIAFNEIGDLIYPEQQESSK